MFFLSLLLIFQVKFEKMKVNPSDDEIKSPLLGKNMPIANIIKFGKGDYINLEKYKNRKFIVNFFASWCIPCKIEAPLLSELSSKIDLIGISYKDKEIDMINFLNNFGNPYREIGIDQSGTIAIEWGVYGVPETFVVNKDGKIIFKHTGPINHKHMKNQILPLIDKND